jgi:hypothetical protein
VDWFAAALLAIPVLGGIAVGYVVHRWPAVLFAVAAGVLAWIIFPGDDEFPDLAFGLIAAWLTALGLVVGFAVRFALDGLAARRSGE